MDALKKIQPAWFAVAVLVVIVLVLLFGQRRSGFTPTAGAPITMMDLQEFSAFTPEQKTMYIQMITDSSQQLSQAAASKSFDAFIAIISNIIRQVMQPTQVVAAPQMPMAPPPQMPMAPPPQTM
jgi:hypothetical protein